MLQITTKYYQYIGVLMLISFIMCIVTPVTGKSLPHIKSHNSQKSNAKVQAPVPHTNEQLHTMSKPQMTGDLRQHLSKAATSRFHNVQQTDVTTRPHLNNIEYDLRLRQLMEELVSNSRIEHPHYAVHTLLPLEFKDTYQQHVGAMGATATATAAAAAAPVSIADKPNFTHNNQITTSNDRENYQQQQQQQNQHHKDNKDFVYISSYFTPANELLLLDRRNTSLTKDTTNTTTTQTSSSSSSSSSAFTSSLSSLNASAVPSLSTASLKDSLLDYVLLEYMTKTKHNLTNIFEINQVEGNSSVALPNSQKIRQQLEFLQKNAEKFKNLQQVEERTRNASAVTEWDVLKDIDAIQQNALKEYDWMAFHNVDDKDLRVEIWKEVSNDNPKKTENFENGTNNHVKTQPNVTNIVRLEEFSIQIKQNGTGGKISENSENLTNSIAFKTSTSTKTDFETQSLEKLPILKNTLVGSGLGFTNSNESLVLKERISNNDTTATPISDSHLMMKNSTTDSDEGKDIDSETISSSKFSEVMKNVETVPMSIMESQNITTEYKIQSTNETGIGTEYSDEAQLEALSIAGNYENRAGLEEDISETTGYISIGNLTTPKESNRKTVGSNPNIIQHLDTQFELEDTKTIKTGTENKSSGSTGEELLESPTSTTNPEFGNITQSTIPPPPLMFKNVDGATEISQQEESTSIHTGLLPAAQVAGIQKLDAQTTIEPQVPKAVTYQYEATNQSAYKISNKSQVETTSKIPDFSKVAASNNSVDNQPLTTNVVHESDLASTKISNDSNLETELKTGESPIGVTENPLILPDTSILTIFDRREPESNVINSGIINHQMNADESYQRQTPNKDSKLPTEVPNFLTNSMGTEMEASKYLPSLEMLNLTNTKIPFPHINKTENQLATKFPTDLPTNIPDLTTSYLAVTEDEITTKLPDVITNSWSSVALSFTTESTELQSNHSDTTTDRLSILNYERTSEPSTTQANIYDEEMTELPMADTNPDSIVNGTIKKEPPITETTLAGEGITTETSLHETTPISLLNAANESVTELPINETALRQKEISDSTKSYDDTIIRPSNNLNKLETELPITEVPTPKASTNSLATNKLSSTASYPTRDESQDDFLKTTTEEIPLSTQIPFEELIYNNNINTELPIVGLYLTTDESTDSTQTSTDILSLSAQIRTEESNNYIEITTVLPFTDSQLTEEESTNTLKTTKEEMPTATQIASKVAIANTDITTEDLMLTSRNSLLGLPIANSDLTKELPITGIYFTREQSTDTPGAITEVLPTSSQILAEEITTDRAMATELPTTNIKFGEEGTTDASIEKPTEEPIYKRGIIAELPYLDTKFTTEPSTDTPKTTTEVMPGSTSIETEKAITELPIINTTLADKEIAYPPTTTTQIKIGFAQIPTKKTIYNSKIATELPITNFELTREKSTYSTNELLPTSTQNPTEVLTTDSVLPTELPTTKTNFSGDVTPDTYTTTTEVMPHITLTQISEEDTNIESDITKSLSTTETNLNSFESIDIPKPTVASTRILNSTEFLLPTNANELTTQIPTTKTNIETTKIPAPTGVQREETPNAIGIVSHIQANLKAVLPITTIPFATKEITPVSETNVVMKTNHTELLIEPSELKDESFTELPIIKILLPHLKDIFISKSEELILNDIKGKSDYNAKSKLTLPTAETHEKVGISNNAVNISAESSEKNEFNTDYNKTDRKFNSLLNNKDNFHAALLGAESEANLNQSLKPITDKDAKETEHTSKESHKTLNKLSDDVVLQFVLNNKSSTAGYSDRDSFMVAKVQFESLKDEQSAVSTNAIKTENSQSDNPISEKLLVPALPTINLKSEQTNAFKFDISQSDTQTLNRLHAPELPTENLKTEQSAISTYDMKSEAPQSANLTLDGQFVPELPTGNLKTEQSAVSTYDMKSEAPEGANLILDGQLGPELTTQNLKTEQSAFSTNDIKSETFHSDNLIPDKLLVPELPIQILRTEQSAVSTNTIKSETSQSDKLIPVGLLLPVLPAGDLNIKHSAVSTNAINSETPNFKNLLPNGQLIPEVQTENLKSELSADSVNATTVSVSKIPHNFETFHLLQSKIDSLKENIENTKNGPTLEHKIAEVMETHNGSSEVSLEYKQDLNFPEVEIFLQGITSQEVNAINDNVGYSHLAGSTENIRTVGNINITEQFKKSDSIKSKTDASLENHEQVNLESQGYGSLEGLPLKPESYTDKGLQFESNEVNKFSTLKPLKDLEQRIQDELDLDDSYQNIPTSETVWLLQPSSWPPTIIHQRLTVPYKGALTQPFSSFAEQLPNAAKLEIVKPQETPESRLDELITIIGNSMQATSGSNTKPKHVAGGVTRQCLDNNYKQQQQEQQQHQHQGLTEQDDGTAALVNCSSATEQTMQLTTLPSTPSTALTAAAITTTTTLALRTISQKELENVQTMAISKTVENQKDNKGKWPTFENNHLNNDSLTKADDNEDVQIPEITKENANDHNSDEDEDKHMDDTEDDEGVHEVDAANKSSINDKDIRLETKVRPDIVMATEVNASDNSHVEAEQHNDGHVLDRTNNAQYTNNAFKISTATNPMTAIDDGSVEIEIEVEGGLNEMSTIETKLFDISKDNRNDMTITGLQQGGHNTNPLVYKVVNGDVTTIGPKKDYKQKGNEHEMTQGNNKDAVMETDDYEKGDHQYIATFPFSSSSDETEQDEVISANIEALDAVAQEVEQLSTLTDTFLNTQSFPDVTPYHSNLYYKSPRSRKKKQKLKKIHASVNPHSKEEITTTNWWHSLPYAEIRKFLNSISDSVESW